MKTFEQWVAAGRSVRKGEKARFFAVRPDKKFAMALFEEDQTTEEASPMTDDWITMTAEEWQKIRPTPKNKDPRPKIKLDQAGDYVTVWCGNNQKAIDGLKKGGWLFDMRTHRWRARGKEIAEVTAGFEKVGFKVEIEEPAI